MVFRLVCIVSVIASTLIAGGSMKYLEIRVRKDRYEARHADVVAGLIDLWDGGTQHPAGWDNWTQDQKAFWVDTGWQKVYLLSNQWHLAVYNTNGVEVIPDPAPTEEQTFYNYKVSMLQTGHRASPTRIQYWKGVAGNPHTFKVFIDGTEQ